MVLSSGLWRRVPVVLRAVVIGMVVTAAGTIPWAVLVGANVRLSPSVPWAVAAMTGWLYLYWKYWSGAWWPQSTMAVRRESIRSVVLPKQIWRWSLWTGALGATSLVALEMVVLRMVHVSATSRAPLPRMPMYSLVAFAVMSALAAGIPEEVGFRGYMQVPIERRYGPMFGVLFVAFVFALAHLNHGLSIFIAFDFLFGLVFGILAYGANSLLPGATLHCVLDVILFVAGRRIAAPLVAKPLIWSAGTDFWFWACSVAFVLLGVGAVYAYRTLVRLTPDRWQPVA